MKFQMNDSAIIKQVNELMAQMSIEDKVLQMVYVDGPVPGNEAIIKEGRVGCVANVFTSSEINKIQSYTEKTKHAIPYLMIADVIQGYKTIFPIPLAEACSFDPDMVEKTSKAAAREAGASGINWIAGPMVDVARDPRWGRIAEGAGEDTYLNGVMGAARVKGYKDVDRMISCTKHYLAYGTGEGGRDYNTAEVSENTLRNVYLPPFKACVEAGTESIMIAFNDALGVPMSANKYLLQDVLRDELGFEGHLATDYQAIRELITHGVASDSIEACRKAINAGSELDMAANIYIEHLTGLIESGEVDSGIIDRAVLRILYIKFSMGIFENRYYDEELEKTITLGDDLKKIALESARNSIVLLKNDHSILPLKKSGSRILVTGPLADNNDAPLGWWRCQGKPENVITVLDAIKNTVAEKSTIEYLKGCEIIGGGSDEIESTVKAAGNADVIIAVIGEHAKMSGEAHCRSDISLPGRQLQLLAKLRATGKPIIAVLINGRPLDLSSVIEYTDAIVEAWQFGISGQAVADIIFGDFNPSAKTCVTFPRRTGQIPIYYNHKTTGRPHETPDTIEHLNDEALASFQTTFNSKYMDLKSTPLFPFGFGLSYTTFSYTEVAIENSNETFTAWAEVTNTGKVAGAEIVQLYIGDVTASITRPVKELKGFVKLHLAPGESKRAEFTISPDMLSFYNFENKLVVEPGQFKVWIAPDSATGNYQIFEIKES